jgi:hypothetical protein
VADANLGDSLVFAFPFEDQDGEVVADLEPLITVTCAPYAGGDLVEIVIPDDDQVAVYDANTKAYYYLLAGTAVVTRGVYVAMAEVDSEDVTDKRPRAAQSVGRTWIAAAQNASDILDDLTEDNEGTFRFTAAALINAAGTSASAIADAVWNRLASAITTAGSVGKYIIDRLGIIGTAGALTVGPSTTRGETMRIKRGVSMTRYTGSYYNCDLIAGFDESTDVVKLIIEMEYDGGQQFIKTIPLSSITIAGDYLQVNPYSILTSARTAKMPLGGSFDAQIVAFIGGETNAIMNFPVEVSDPGFNYTATDVA